MPEVPLPHESHIPEGLKLVPEMQNIDGILANFGNDVAQIVQKYMEENPNAPAFVVPLMGSLLPLHYVFSALSKNPNLLSYIDPHVTYVSTQKNGRTAECQVLSEVVPPSFQQIITIEDIFDDGGTAAALEATFPDNQSRLWYLAPFRKPHANTVSSLLCRTTLKTYRQIPNNWVVGGGMDGGRLKLNGSTPRENAELAYSQRLCAHGVAYQEGYDVPYEAQLAFFESMQIPGIPDDLKELMIQAEEAKITGNTDALRALTPALHEALVSSVRR